MFDELYFFYVIYEHSIASALISAILALSVYISFRAGIFNMSAIGFMALGAYTSGIVALNFGTPSIVGIMAGVLVALLIGVALVFPVLKLRGHYLAIATLSFSAIVQSLALNLDFLTNGPGGLIGVPATIRIWHLLLVLCLLLYCAWTVQQSRIGRAWDAIRTDMSASRSLGINVEYYRLSAFLISTAISALAGGLWAHVNRVVVPSEFGFTQLTLALMNTLLGGLANPFGPVISSLVVSTMPDWLQELEHYREIIIGLLLVVIVIYLPNGIMPRSFNILSLKRRRSGSGVSKHAE